ncbi:hypothetical protein T4D_16849 [Trichinella pseudospiralis]|uniref:Uncharacterized protein n=1 Tax=Trichinella pseudospiralis TaxID=6337 RepID=A0A0V1F5G6_TRIPS|nr:hypothetical protein T4D_16849 [Trichinella pseudospiralis]
MLGCSKDNQVCKAAISNYLEVTMVLRQTMYMETCIYMTTLYVPCKEFPRKAEIENLED